jgi:hypothetical protein
MNDYLAIMLDDKKAYIKEGKVTGEFLANYFNGMSLILHFYTCYIIIDS